MGRDQRLPYRNPGNAANSLIGAENRISKKCLMQAAFCRHWSFGFALWTLGRDEGLRFCAWSQTTHLPGKCDQRGPIAVKLIPHFPIKLARVSQSGDLPFPQLRIESTKVAEFASYRRGRPVEKPSEGLHFGIRGLRLPERDAAVQLKGQDRLLARPRLAIVCGSCCHRGRSVPRARWR